MLWTWWGKCIPDGSLVPVWQKEQKDPTEYIWSSRIKWEFQIMNRPCQWIPGEFLEKCSVDPTISVSEIKKMKAGAVLVGGGGVKHDGSFLTFFNLMRTTGFKNWISVWLGSNVMWNPDGGLTSPERNVRSALWKDPENQWACTETPNRSDIQTETTVTTQHTHWPAVRNWWCGWKSVFIKWKEGRQMCTDHVTVSFLWNVTRLQCHSTVRRPRRCTHTFSKS